MILLGDNPLCSLCKWHWPHHLTVAGVWLTHRTIPPKDATWEDILVEAQRGAY
jgi:hypothetical protein